MLLSILVLPIFLSLAFSSSTGPEDDPFVEVLTLLGKDKGIRERLLSKLKPSVYKYVKKQERLRDLVPMPNNIFTCAGCTALVDMLNGMINDGLEFPDVSDDFLQLCEDLLGVIDPRSTAICPGIVDLQFRHAYRVFSERGLITSDEACRTVNFCRDEDIEPFHPAKHHNRRLRKSPVSKRSKATEADLSNALKMVQITDIHIEPEYAEGSATDCGFPVCCRSYWEGEGSAGRWGTRGCNTPLRTANWFLRQISGLQPDHIFYSGDVPPHALWNETLESQIRHSRDLTNILRTALPNVPIYASIGNHELFPTNLYHMSLPATRSFNQAFGELWGATANFTQTQIDSINRGGFYSMPLRPNLKLIVYNSDYGYNMNWYILWSKDDPEYQEMKDFVRRELQAARSANEKVILMGHHPTGTGTLDDFSTWLSDLSLQYNQEIVLSLFGHTHRDGFKLVTTPGAERALNVHYVAPSMTAYPVINPSARVYYLDRRNFTLLDYEQYYMDLDAANQAGDNTPQLQMTYSARRLYNLPDMSATSWQQFVARMEADDSVFQSWYSNTLGRSPATGSCDASCKYAALCNIKHTTSVAYNNCMDNEPEEP